jgi:hypothetical protein
MSETPHDNQMDPELEQPQFPDTSKAEPVINKRMVTGAVTAALLASAAAYEAGVFDTPPPSKPKVGRLMTAPNASKPSPAGPKPSHVEFTVRSGKRLQPSFIYEDREGKLTAYNGDGMPVNVHMDLPTHIDEGPGQLFKDAGTNTEPHIDYVAGAGSENVSRRRHGDTIVTTFAPAPEGEIVHIHSDGHGGLVATHGGQPVLTTLDVPAPPPDAR